MLAPPARLDLPVSGMTCASCAARLQKVLGRVEGVEGVAVNYATTTATLSLRPGAVDRARLVTAIEAAGFSVPEDEGLDLPARVALLDEADQELAATLRRDATLALIGALPVAVLGMGFMHWAPGHWASALISALVVFGAGRRLFVDGFQAARQGSATMNTLVAIGASAAWLLSMAALLWPSAFPTHAVYFESAAVVVALVLLGRALEGRARRQAGEAVRALLALAPAEAWVFSGGEAHPVPTAAVRVGDLLLARPGDTIAADGRVEEGHSTISEALLTGESRPVAKAPGSALLAGTQNGAGPLVYRATATGAATALAAIGRAVHEAQGGRPPIQDLVDRVAAVFTPVVLLLSGLTLGAWLLAGAPFAEALLYAVAVLVIACPCALGLATPTAILVGTGAAARQGVLFRELRALEAAAIVTTVVFDKTGTLTTGHFGLSAVEPLVDSLDADGLLTLVSAVEARSEHPIGAALVAAARARGLPMISASAVQSTPGAGIVGEVEGARVEIGSRTALAVELPPSPAEARGATTVFVRRDSELVGRISLEDPLRPEAIEALADLRAIGVRAVLCSGDAPAAAAALGDRLGLDEATGGHSPQDKLELLRSRAQRGGVAMVGDGVNDAPALAAATVGIAMGSASQASQAAAPVVLLRDDLRLVPQTLRLARRTAAIIRQNLVWAFVYNLIAIPVAAGVLVPLFDLRLSPMMASAAMALSSLSVVLNSLRLRATP